MAEAAPPTRAEQTLADVIGKTYDPFEYAVGREKIREYATAVGETSPLHLDPAAAREAPNRRHYAGLEALAAYLHARRAVLYERFLRDWTRLEKAGFRASLDGDGS